MINDFIKRYEPIKRKVYFKDIKEKDRLEERFFDIEQYFGDIVGMNINSVEFCPNHEPPLKDEILPWLWLIYPECKEELLQYANDNLKIIITEYINCNATSTG
jgi:hypothetical protein